MSNHKTRPARSNSLQRMLELERRYMLERLHSSSVAKKTSASAIPASPTALKNITSPSTTRPMIQARRTEDQSQYDVGKPTGSPYEKKTVSPRVPLTINTNSAKPNNEPPLELDQDALVYASVTMASTPTDKPASKAVSFDIPDDGDDRSSICQSPSWEAYGRRKKDDKKEQKKEQQKREQQLKEQQKKEQQKKEQQMKELQLKEQKRGKAETPKSLLTKKKRLSKQPPPASSPQAFEHVSRMTSRPASGIKEKQRPASALGLTTPIKDDAPPTRKTRSRSNSFTDLIKAPFGSRRSSIDATPLNESGFIGGIKLEIERHTVYHNVLKSQEKAEEAGLHPALRTDNLAAQKSLDSVKHPLAVRPAQDPQRRAYPPITRHPNAAAKTRSLVSPATSQVPDVSAIDKLRAFVRPRSRRNSMVLKDVSQSEEVKKPAPPSEAARSASSLTAHLLQSHAKTEAVPDPRPNTSAGLLPSPTVLRQDDRISLGMRNISSAPLLNSQQPSSSASPDQRNDSNAAPATVGLPKPAKAEVEDVDKQTPIISPAQDISPSKGSPRKAARPIPLSAPPEPPRRSSKRNSIQSLDGSISSLSSPGEKPSSRSPSRRPVSSADSNHSMNDLRPPPILNLGAYAEGVSIVSPAISVESHASTATFSTPHEHHSHSAKSSMDSTESINNELGTSGAPLLPSTPRQAPPKLEKISVPTWEDIQSSVMQAIDTKISLSPIRKSHNSLRDDSDFTVRRITDDSVPATSSDDSSTDDFHSPSMPSTPDTSRPQSEKELPPVFSDLERRLAMHEPRPRNDSQSPVRGRTLQQLETVPSQDSLGKGSKSEPRADTPPHAAAAKASTKVPITQLPRPVVPPRIYSATEVVPETSFLPKLKHQPLKLQEKALQKSGTSSSPRPLGDERAGLKAPSSTFSPWPASYLEEARKATPLAPPPQVLKSQQYNAKITPPSSIHSSSTTDLTTKSGRHTSALAVGGEPIAKMFVECCGCKFYHDMPSNLYEVMADPDSVMRASGKHGFAGAISMTVKCPWCSHEMSTRCCAGYAAMVYLKEKLH